MVFTQQHHVTAAVAVLTTEGRILLSDAMLSADLCFSVHVRLCRGVTMCGCGLPVPEMNRHHYSLYVHNCRLVFLLRRDFTQVDAFRPAEFHWKLEQVSECVCVCVCARVCVFNLNASID